MKKFFLMLKSIFILILLFFFIWNYDVAHLGPDNNILDLGSEVIARLSYDQSVLKTINDLIGEEPIFKISPRALHGASCNEKFGIAHAFSPTMVLRSSLNKEETVANSLGNSLIGLGILSTNFAKQNASTPTARTTALIAGFTGTIFASGGIKFAGELIATYIKKAPDSLGDNSRPPSPGLGPNINSPLENIWDWLGVTNIIESNPEYGLMLCIFGLSIINLILLIYIVGNYIFKNWISPKIESKIKSKWLLWLLNYNKKVSILFLYYSFFMLLFNCFFMSFFIYVIIYFTDIFKQKSINRIENELEITDVVDASSDSSFLSIDSPFEDLFNIPDPYLGLMIMVILWILLTIYLYTVVIINLINPEFLKVNSDRFKNKYIILWLKYIEKSKQYSLKFLIILVYLCLLSALFFMFMLINLYPPSF